MTKLKPNQFLLGGHLITERPILFQTEMVRANMEDRKTMTRREIKGQPTGDQAINLKDVYDHNPEYFYEICPYGKPGDLLWVRENYLKIPYVCGGQKGFKISFPDRCSPGVIERLSLKPSIHLPKSASRIWAMVEEVRVERVQDISEDDAIDEGCSKYGPFGEYKGSRHPNGGSMRYRAYDKALRAFQCIWESINGEESWKSNPWVWVVKYRILSKTGRPADNTILHHYLNIVKGEKNYMTI